MRGSSGLQAQYVAGMLAGFVGCCVVNAQITKVPRHPQGVYVFVGPVVLGSKVINPGPDQAVDADLLAKNPGVAGLTVYVQWSVLNPNPPKDNRLPDPLDCRKLKGHTDPADPYDWSLTDAAFCAAASASPPRTINLVVRPAFYTPRWVLDQINANSCSGQFVFLPEPYYVPASPLPPLPPNPTPFWPTSPIRKGCPCPRVNTCTGLCRCPGTRLTRTHGEGS